MQLINGVSLITFRWKEYYYAIAKNWNSGWGELYRSKDGLTPFDSRGRFVYRLRHCAVMLRDNQLLVFYTVAGEMGIAMAELDIKIK